VQIYCPYLVVNKTGLPFGVKAARSHRATPPVEIAADTRLGKLQSTTYHSLLTVFVRCYFQAGSILWVFTYLSYHDGLIISLVLSHPHDNGQAFVFKVGESGWSKVQLNDGKLCLLYSNVAL
jgi:vacuolar protein sorting-associated protein 13A/C